MKAMKMILALATASAFVVALAQTPPVREAKLSWSPVTTATDNSLITGVTYNIYQGAKGATKAKIKSGVTAVIFTASALPPGETCFNVSAQTAANGEGGVSSEACKSLPFSAPNEPATLTVQ